MGAYVFHVSCVVLGFPSHSLQSGKNPGRDGSRISCFHGELHSIWREESSQRDGGGVNERIS